MNGRDQQPDQDPRSGAVEDLAVARAQARADRRSPAASGWPRRGAASPPGADAGCRARAALDPTPDHPADHQREHKRDADPQQRHLDPEQRERQQHRVEPELRRRDQERERGRGRDPAIDERAIDRHDPTRAQRQRQPEHDPAQALTQTEPGLACLRTPGSLREPRPPNPCWGFGLPSHPLLACCVAAAKPASQPPGGRLAHHAADHPGHAVRDQQRRRAVEQQGPERVERRLAPALVELAGTTNSASTKPRARSARRPPATAVRGRPGRATAADPMADDVQQQAADERLEHAEQRPVGELEHAPEAPPDDRRDRDGGQRDQGPARSPRSNSRAGPASTRSPGPRGSDGGSPPTRARG